jgi:hypothetical protein
MGYHGGNLADAYETGSTKGRWPANVILDPDAAAILDQQSGEAGGGSKDSRGRAHGFVDGRTSTRDDVFESYADSGGASRFFKVIQYAPNEMESACTCASSVESPSSLPSAPGDSAPSDAVIPHLSDDRRKSPARSTSGKAGASSQSDASDTPPILNTASGYSPEVQPAKPSQTPSPANRADQHEQTDTTTTTTSHSSSRGCAVHATSGDTSRLPGVGEADSVRFRYTPKADAHQRPRVNGVSHPTVKPVDLMAWLCRLITPPGGVILDPFAGSGTTLEAAIVERFRVIGIEREADYIPLIMQRLTRGIEVTLL